MSDVPDRADTNTSTNPPQTAAAIAMQSQPRKPRRLLGLKEVVWRTSLSRATIYRLLYESRETGVILFPLPVQVNKGRIGWHEHEIEVWIELRPRVSTEDVIAALQLGVTKPNSST